MKWTTVLTRQFIIAFILLTTAEKLYAVLPPLMLTKTINNPDPRLNGDFGFTLNSFNGNVLVGAPGNRKHT
jgi:hypothetical protein